MGQKIIKNKILPHDFIFLKMYARTTKTASVRMTKVHVWYLLSKTGNTKFLRNIHTTSLTSVEKPFIAILFCFFEIWVCFLSHFLKFQLLFKAMKMFDTYKILWQQIVNISDTLWSEILYLLWTCHLARWEPGTIKWADEREHHFTSTFSQPLQIGHVFNSYPIF